MYNNLFINKIELPDKHPQSFKMQKAFIINSLRMANKKKALIPAIKKIFVMACSTNFLVGKERPRQAKESLPCEEMVYCHLLVATRIFNQYIAGSIWLRWSYPVDYQH